VRKEGYTCFFRLRGEIRDQMNNVIKSAMVQTSVCPSKNDNIEKNVNMIKEAASLGAQIVCLQELFYTQYFASEQDPKWLALAESIPGPTIEIMQDLAVSNGIVLVVPIMEADKPGVYYNTTVVIDADGQLLGKYRKIHLPHFEGFWEQYYFKKGDLGYPVFKTAYATIGIMSDYDRLFPEVPRILALKGAQIIYNPCTTVMDLSRHIWFITQRGHAISNAVFVGTSNRVGKEPYSPGVYYGMSYFCSPNGEILIQGSQNQDEIVIAELDLGLIDREREKWNLLRTRQPDTYEELLK